MLFLESKFVDNVPFKGSLAECFSFPAVSGICQHTRASSSSWSAAARTVCIQLLLLAHSSRSHQLQWCVAGRPISTLLLEAQRAANECLSFCAPSYEKWELFLSPAAMVAWEGKQIPVAWSRAGSVTGFLLSQSLRREQTLSTPSPC